MTLTERQKDSLIELINIAFGRATASLSDLTGQRVLLRVPKVAIHPMHELVQIFGNISDGEVATVHQIFSGSVAGNALLLLDYRGALALSGLLLENRSHTEHLDASDCEVLGEVGNILLNACLGTFGNILQVHICFSVPCMNVEPLQTVLDSLSLGSKELKYALVIFTNFRLKDSDVEGYLIMVLEVASLEHLMQAIERLD
jgi:chemotaxis protein CheC